MVATMDKNRDMSMSVAISMASFVGTTVTTHDRVRNQGQVVFVFGWFKVAVCCTMAKLQHLRSFAFGV